MRLWQRAVVTPMSDREDLGRRLFELVHTDAVWPVGKVEDHQLEPWRRAAETIAREAARGLDRRLDHAYETIDTFAGERDEARAERDALIQERATIAEVRSRESAEHLRCVNALAALKHELHNARASVDTYREQAEIRERYMVRQARVCHRCPGGTQLSLEAVECPSCGEPYPLQSLERVKAAEAERDALRVVLKGYEDAEALAEAVRLYLRQDADNKALKAQLATKDAALRTSLDALEHIVDHGWEHADHRPDECPGDDEDGPTVRCLNCIGGALINNAHAACRAALESDGGGER